MQDSEHSASEDQPGAEQAATDWNELHRQNYMRRGRKMGVVLAAVGIAIFALVAVVILLAA